jgi:hypothetical protein
MSTIGEFIAELGAGVYEEKLEAVLKNTATTVMANNREGEIILKFKIKPINQSQCKVQHTLERKAPTLNGMITEKDTTETVMFVGEKGKMSIFPENQTQMFTKSGSVTSA